MKAANATLYVGFRKNIIYLLSGVMFVSNVNAACPAPGTGIVANGITLNEAGCTINTVSTFGLNATNGGVVTFSNGSISVRNSYAANALGSGTSVTLNNIFMDTFGVAAFGLYVSNNAHVIMNDSDITTVGLSASGVMVDSNSPGGVVELNRCKVTTNALNAYGVSIKGSTFDISDSNIKTWSNAHALFVQQSSTVVTTNTNFDTVSDIASGIYVQDGSNVSASNVRVTTQGSNSHGYFINGTSPDTILTSVGSNVSTRGANSYGLYFGGNQPGCKVTVNNGEIDTSGINSHSIVLVDNATEVELANSRINSTGTNAAGFYSASTTSVMNAVNSTFSAANGTIFHIDSGTATVNLTGVIANAASAQKLLYVNNNATLNLIAERSTLSGKILAEAIASATVTFKNGTIFTGSIDPVDLNIDSSSIWNLDATSIVNNLVNSGNINFVPNGNNFKNLTTSTYIGQNGFVTLNTFLDEDDSPSDLFIIDNGNASGVTGLHINNTTGLGAVTEGNGILVVNTINGGTTNNDAFYLADSVMAGPYEYTLYRGDISGAAPDNWYLRSIIDDPDDPLDGEPDYRPEVSLYTSGPSAILLYNTSVLGTFHQRVGAEEQVHRLDKNFKNYVNGVWLRGVYNNGSIKNGGILMRGPDFDYHFITIQGGVDIYHQEYTNLHRDYAGLYATIGAGGSAATHYTGVNAGSFSFDAKGVGMYWTHITANDAYLDGVLQLNFYKPKASSHRAVLERPTGTCYAASIEGGYPLQVTRGFSIEPQTQFIYQLLSDANGRDEAAEIHFDSTKSFIGRGALRLNYDKVFNRNSKGITRKLNLWCTGSIWYQSDAKSQVSFLSDTGYIPFISNLSGTWMQVELGVTGQVNSVISLYGTTSKQIYTSGHGNAYMINGGIRLNW